MKNILSGLDRPEPLPEGKASSLLPGHLCGVGCYGEAEGAAMLMDSTVERMQAVKLTALAETCRAQLTRPEFAELEFAGHVGWMVDPEWTSREVGS